MKPAHTDHLARTRRLLKDLDQCVHELVERVPDLKEGDPGELLRRFQTASVRGFQRLDKPTLSLVTVGTPSAGKSTLANAFIGRRIAPMDADEKSAGILTLVHSEASRLVVEETEDPAWEVGNWTGLSDKEIYLRLGAVKERDGVDGIMSAYHRTRRERYCEAPRVRVELPLLPMMWPELLGLPPGIGFEVHDLQGLKVIQDPQTLRLVQEQVSRSFAVVALDYSQADDGNRKGLLAELKQVIDRLGGDIESMLLVLNGIDRRGIEDESIELRIRKLSEEIARALALKSPPPILPIEARLLYYVQCAWGAAPPSGQPSTPPQQREFLLRGMLHDCTATLKRQKGDRVAKEWLLKTEDELSSTSVDDLRELLLRAMEWSKGTAFWEELRRRLDESFFGLVVLPAISETLFAFQDFVAKAHSIAAICGKDSLKALESAQAQIKAAHAFVTQHIDIRRSQFRSRVENALSGFREGTPEGHNRAIDQLGPGFRPITQAVLEVKAELHEHLIEPVRDAFLSGRSSLDLEDQLKQEVPPYMARDLARAYDLLSRNGLTPEVAKSGTVRKLPKDESSVRALQEQEKHAVRMYYQMRRGLSHRAQFALQGKAKTIQNALHELFRGEAEELGRLVHRHVDDKLLADAFISSTPEALANPDSLMIPETIFQLPDMQRVGTEVVTQKIGERTKRVRWTTGSCIKTVHSEDVIEEIHGPVAYVSLRVRGANEMAGEWSLGIQQTEPLLWTNLLTWIQAAFEQLLRQHGQTVNQAVSMMNDVFASQIGRIEERRELETQKWHDVSDRLTRAEEIARALRSGDHGEP